MTDQSSQGTPTTHPSSSGLEGAVRSEVTKQLDSRGSGGGGGSDDTDVRLGAVERDVATIKATMVTQADFEKKVGELSSQIAGIPFTILKWFIGFVLSICMFFFAVVKITESDWYNNLRNPQVQNSDSIQNTSPSTQDKTTSTK